MGYPSNIFIGKEGIEPLRSIFNEYHNRDVLLSFRGSLSRKNGAPEGDRLSHLASFRIHNVRELYAKRNEVKRTSFFREIFWAPGVQGLQDLDAASADGLADAAQNSLAGSATADNATSEQFSREGYKTRRFSSSTDTILTYLRSQFCFEPPGALSLICAISLLGLSTTVPLSLTSTLPPSPLSVAPQATTSTVVASTTACTLVASPCCYPTSGGRWSLSPVAFCDGQV
jgi:hypothetical protein